MKGYQSSVKSYSKLGVFQPTLRLFLIFTWLVHSRPVITDSEGEGGIRRERNSRDLLMYDLEGENVGSENGVDNVGNQTVDTFRTKS